MSIQVEFFGIPRQRAGVPATTVQVEGQAMRLSDILADLAARYPRFAETCVDRNRLRPDFRASINGRCFVSRPETLVRTGDSLLLMSADAGG